MNKKLLLLLPALALLGQGCEMSDTGTKLPGPMDPPSATSTDTIKTGDDGFDHLEAELPQVYFFNKLAFTTREINDVKNNVVRPLVSYYEGLPDYRVVAVIIRRTDSGIDVEAIVDQADSEGPVYHGFVHPRSGGGYPMWYPEEVPPEYRG